MGMVFKNIKYMNGGCFENLSGTSVPKSMGGGDFPSNAYAKDGKSILCNYEL